MSLYLRYSGRIRIVEDTPYWTWGGGVAGTKEGIDGSERLIERFCRMEGNFCWNKLEKRILRTSVVRYVAMNSQRQRLRHPALMASFKMQHATIYTEFLSWDNIYVRLFRTLKRLYFNPPVRYCNLWFDNLCYLDQRHTANIGTMGISRRSNAAEQRVPLQKAC